MDILIGTKNIFKVQEMLWHLEGLPNITIHYLDELDKKIEVEEDGKTLVENAEKKATEISKYTDWIVFTSDAGIDIPGLGDKWDMTKPKRLVGGEKASARERIDTLLTMMKDLKGEDRACHFIIALALAQHGKLLWSAQMEGESGFVVEEDHTENIEPDRSIAVVWFYPDLGKTDYQLNTEERTKIRKKHQQPLKDALQQQLHKI